MLYFHLLQIYFWTSFCFFYMLYFHLLQIYFWIFVFPLLFALLSFWNLLSTNKPSNLKYCSLHVLVTSTSKFLNTTTLRFKNSKHSWSYFSTLACRKGIFGAQIKNRKWCIHFMEALLQFKLSFVLFFLGRNVQFWCIVGIIMHSPLKLMNVVPWKFEENISFADPCALSACSVQGLLLSSFMPFNGSLLRIKMKIKNWLFDNGGLFFICS
jgi:hypothetical protein